ncbi:MAG: flagellar biosynthetic protein FliO [Thermoguttaceae bacterium]|nr:flagellar biosynthetic protein FliO [Thermoguttaceae bacterium]
MSIILILLLTIFSLPVTAEAATPLAPDTRAQQEDNSAQTSTGVRIMPTIGAVAIVAGTFALILWLLKKYEGGSGRIIPDSIVKTLGKTRIGTAPVFLVAVGKKLVLVAVSSNGLTPLTEIDDPAEADVIRKALLNEEKEDK